MKTSYWKLFFWIGIILALSIGSQIGSPLNNGTSSQAMANITLMVTAIVFVGYGLKLKILVKKGIKNTKDVKKLK